MAQMHRLSRQDARRIAVRAQFLTAERPADLLTLVRRLTMLQLDPVSAIAPSADLVAWSRLGSSYEPKHLQDALADRHLIELRAFLRPAEDLALYRARDGRLARERRTQRLAASRPGTGSRPTTGAAATSSTGSGRKVRSRRERSPTPATRPWESTGWTGNKNVVRLLDFMVSRGEVAVAGRKGRERLWDLAERVYPDHPVIPADEAERERDRRRLHALGIARLTGPEVPIEPAVVGDAGEPAVVEGVRGEWRVDPAYLDGLSAPFEPRAALLSPFDRLAHDRVRAAELFGFEYQLEMYKPAAKRRWGYYALPILYGDQLVGKLDATADRKAGVLTVNAIHQDVPFTADMTDAINAEIASLAAWLNLDAAHRAASNHTARTRRPRTQW